MNNNCINNLIKLICLLQKNSIDSNYNTRVINIYNKQGSLFIVNIDNIDISNFRIENIENNYVTLRALINNEGILETTSNYITINTNCIYVVRCLEDVFINNL